MPDHKIFIFNYVPFLKTKFTGHQRPKYSNKDVSNLLF